MQAEAGDVKRRGIKGGWEGVALLRGLQHLARTRALQTPRSHCCQVSSSPESARGQGQSQNFFTYDRSLQLHLQDPTTHRGKEGHQGFHSLRRARGTTDGAVLPPTIAFGMLAFGSGLAANGSSLPAGAPSLSELAVK